MNALECIAARKSVRDYDRAPAGAALLESVKQFGMGAAALTATPMRLHLLTEAEMGTEVKGLLGDYGRTIHAPHYLVLTSAESQHYLVDAGYRFEQTILEATRLGLGTCWVGGFFRESTLGARLGLAAGERVIAMTPLGTPARSTSFLGKTVRALVKSSTRKPLEELVVSATRGESTASRVQSDDGLRKVLEAMRWAPSWANKQPWRFVLRGDELIIGKAQAQLKEGKDYHLVDCGIAMAHGHLAASELGRAGAWSFAVEPIDVPLEVVASYALHRG